MINYHVNDFQNFILSYNLINLLVQSLVEVPS